MSGSVPGLAAADLVDVRRFTGYPPPGTAGYAPDYVASALAGLSGTGAAQNDGTVWPPFPPQPVLPGQPPQPYVLPVPPPDVVATALTSLAPAEIAQVQVYLGQLRQLETALFNAVTLLAVGKAATFTRNAQQRVELEAHYRSWRLKFCYFMGIDPGPLLDTLIPGAFVA